MPGDKEIISAISPGEQLEHVARHSAGQDVQHTAVRADRFQQLFQRRSPVTCTPPEVLAYIFELYVARLEGLTLDDVPPQGLLCLARVCKLWRAIVGSVPPLWTSIRFYFPKSHQSRQHDVQKFQPIFDLHLERSGTLPISLVFIDRRTYNTATNDLVSLLVDRLRAHAQRWKRISLQLSNGYFPLIYQFTPCDLSSLEYFYVNGDVEIARRLRNPLRLDLTSATNLKSFAYSAPGHAGDDIHIHWENLSEISLTFDPHLGQGHTLYHQLWHLAQCQNITTCSLGIEEDIRPALHNAQTITLPCLQTLCVRRLFRDAYAGGAIDPLILPQLQTLKIDAFVPIGGSQHWHDNNFSRLLTRSGCTLLHLSIQDVGFPSGELLRCLELSPTLRSLRFVPYPRSQDISELILMLDITRTPTGDPTLAQRCGQGLVPLLREITLGSSVEGYLDPMMAMFRSRGGASARASGVAALRRAKVVFFDLWNGKDVEGIRGPEDWLEKVESLRAELAQWASENTGRNENEGRQEDGDEDWLETSVVIGSTRHINGQ